MTFDEAVARELTKARQKFGAIRNAHEGYAVILEEVEEFWDEVRRRDPDALAMLKELIQIGAMVQRCAEDVVEKMLPSGKP